MNVFTLTITAAFASALARVIYRKLIVSGTDPWCLLQVFSLIAFLLVAILFPSPQIENISSWLFIALIANGLLWIAIAILELKAYRYLEASTSAVYDCLSLALIVGSGFLIFQEKFTFAHILGIALVCAALLLRGEILKTPAVRGVCYKLASVLMMTAAFSLDKYLTGFVPASTIMFFGYLIPALGYIALKPSALRNSARVFTRPQFALLVLPILSIIRLFLTLQALSIGNLSITYALLQTELIFVFALEMLFLREVSSAFRRALSCATCAAGAAMLRAPTV